MSPAANTAPIAIDAPPPTKRSRQSKLIDYDTLATVAEMASNGWVQPFGEGLITGARASADKVAGAYKRNVASHLKVDASNVKARVWSPEESKADDADGKWTFAITAKPEA